MTLNFWFPFFHSLSSGTAGLSHWARFPWWGNFGSNLKVLSQVLRSSLLFLCLSIRTQIHVNHLIDFFKSGLTWSVWHTQAGYIIDNHFSFLILKAQCTPSGSESEISMSNEKLYFPLNMLPFLRCFNISVKSESIHGLHASWAWCSVNE